MNPPFTSNLVWIGNAKSDFGRFPAIAKRRFGYQLFLAQVGEHPDVAKPLRGFNGASVLELVEAIAGEAFRVVYTVQIKDTVCVLHCFEKKSSSGRKTSKQDLDTIKRRLTQAQEEFGR